MKKRLIWADLVRILAVYFIIVLHVVSIPNPLKTNFFFTLEVTLADTCVPLLVMLSGALLLGKKESYKVFLRKRVSNVVIPWITWSIIFTAIAVIFENRYSPFNFIYTFHEIFIPFFWFIVLICSLYLLTPALRIFVQAAKTKDILGVIILWFLAICFLPFLRDTQAFPLHVGGNIVQLVVNFIGYFLLGFLIVSAKQTNKQTNKQTKYLTGIGMLFILSILGRSFLEYVSIHSHKPFYNGSDFVDPGLVIVSVSLFSFLYLLEGKYQQIFSNLMRRILFMLSNATLGIYFIHYLFLNRAPLPFLLHSTSLIHTSYNIDLFVNALIFFIASFVIIFLLQKIPFIKNLVT